MKTVRLHVQASANNLRLHEENRQEPGSGEVLVRVRACSISPHDDFVVRGIFPVADGRVPLTEAAGDVVARGEGVTQLGVGDRVVSTFWPGWPCGEMNAQTRRDIPGETIDGYAREYACMPAFAFTKMPPDLSHAEAATLPCAGVTAWRGLVTEGRVRPGDSVLILGSGAVSIFALQFAKAAGARVIATSSSDEKLEQLRRLGADDLINYSTTTNWGERVKALTDGRGVDHVIEVGGPATLSQSIAACRQGGHIALIGVLSGFSGELLIPALFSGQIRVSGISIGSHADQKDMIRAIGVNKIRPVIARRFPLEAIADAFTCFRDQKRFGKVVVEL